ncbi:DUF192 domain-containing protein [Candidatus Parcubacteria bacterium]|nr:DUF192 domain-containing protein [Candidatus Parcubacteria bacterium]
MQKRLWILAIAIILLGVSVKYFPYHRNCFARQSVLEGSLGETGLHLEVADTEVLRSQGLSGRKGLPSNTGMLFIFETPGKYGFWMKDMKFALDMVWISPEKKIVAIDRDVRPESYPQALYPPQDVSYVVEVPAGFSKVHGINVGEKFSIGQ